MSDKKLTVSSSPHFTEGLTTQKIMCGVLLAMLPECIAAVVIFGFAALLRIAVSVFGCVLFEALFQKITKAVTKILIVVCYQNGDFLVIHYIFPPCR